MGRTKFGGPKANNRTLFLSSHSSRTAASLHGGRAEDHAGFMDNNFLGKGGFGGLASPNRRCRGGRQERLRAHQDRRQAMGLLP